MPVGHAEDQDLINKLDVVVEPFEKVEEPVVAQSISDIIKFALPSCELHPDNSAIDAFKDFSKELTSQQARDFAAALKEENPAQTLESLHGVGLHSAVVTTLKICDKLTHQTLNYKLPHLKTTDLDPTTVSDMMRQQITKLGDMLRALQAQMRKTYRDTIQLQGDVIRHGTVVELAQRAGEAVEASDVEDMKLCLQQMAAQVAVIDVVHISRYANGPIENLITLAESMAVVEKY